MPNRQQGLQPPRQYPARIPVSRACAVTGAGLLAGHAASGLF